MIQTDKYGRYHATNEGLCSWYDFACEIFRQAGMDEVKVTPVDSSAFPVKAKRPSNSRLNKEKLTEKGFELSLIHIQMCIRDSLSMLLDCPIVETSALKQTGLDKLIDEAVKVAKKKEADLPKEIFSKELESAGGSGDRVDGGTPVFYFTMGFGRGTENTEASEIEVK